MKKITAIILMLITLVMIINPTDIKELINKNSDAIKENNIKLYKYEFILLWM